MKSKKDKSRGVNDDKKNQITRNEAIRQMGGYAFLTAATLMVLIPTKLSAADSTSQPSSEPPPTPKKHGGIF